MKSSTGLLTGVAAILLACSGHAAPIEGGQSYVLTELGSLPGKEESIATAINRPGQVAGISSEMAFSSAGDFTEEAFRSNPKTGTIEAVARQPMSGATRVFGINDAGVAVGDSTFGAEKKGDVDPAREAAIFVNGSSAALIGTPTSRESRAMDINNSGVVVGFLGSESGAALTRAFVWSASTGQLTLGTLGGASSRAYAVNDSGLATGTSDLDPNSRLGGSRHAFRVQLGTAKAPRLVDLGTLGGDSSYGMAVSEKGHIAGYSNTATPEGLFHAFLYKDGKMQDLGSLSPGGDKTDQSFALGVNSAGQVVGYGFVSPSSGVQQVGFVFRDGVMHDLNEAIGGAAKRYLVYMAHAINDDGQIAATAFDMENSVFRAVLLTPVQLPSRK